LTEQYSVIEDASFRSARFGAGRRNAQEIRDQDKRCRSNGQPSGKRSSKVLHRSPYHFD
jgi:hypothetical protein